MSVTAFMYPQALITTFNKEADWDSDTIKVALTNTAYTYVNSHKYFDVAPFSTAITELGTANGYTAGGVTVAGTINAIATQTFSYTVANAVWTASGAGISAVNAFVYDSTPGSNKPLLSYILFGGVVTAAAGATLTVSWSSNVVSIVVA